MLQTTELTQHDLSYSKSHICLCGQGHLWYQLLLMSQVNLTVLKNVTFWLQGVILKCKIQPFWIAELTNKPAYNDQ